MPAFNQEKLYEIYKLGNSRLEELESRINDLETEVVWLKTDLKDIQDRMPLGPQ